MKIKKFSQYKESISGWELVGRDMGPNYPEQKLPVTLDKSDTQVIMGKNNKFYTYDDFQLLYQHYLKMGGDKIPNIEFNQENLDSLITQPD
jgi:hypothetical protein